MTIKFLNVLEDAANYIDLKLTPKQRKVYDLFLKANDQGSSCATFGNITRDLLEQIWRQLPTEKRKAEFVAAYSASNIAVNAFYKFDELRAYVPASTIKSWMNSKSLPNAQRIESLRLKGMDLNEFNLLTKNPLREAAPSELKKPEPKKAGKKAVVKTSGKKDYLRKKESPAQAMKLLVESVAKKDEDDDRLDVEHEGAEVAPIQTTLQGYFGEYGTNRLNGQFKRDFDLIVKVCGEVHPLFDEFARSDFGRILVEYWADSITCLLHVANPAQNDTLEISTKLFSLRLRENELSVIVHHKNGDATYSPTRKVITTATFPRMQAAMGVFNTLDDDDLNRMLSNIGFVREESDNLYHSKDDQFELVSVMETAHFIIKQSGLPYPKIVKFQDGAVPIQELLMKNIENLRGATVMFTRENNCDVLNLEAFASEYNAFRVTIDKPLYVFDSGSADQLLRDFGAEKFNPDQDYSEANKHGMRIIDSVHYVTVSFPHDGDLIQVIAYR